MHDLTGTEPTVLLNGGPVALPRGAVLADLLERRVPGGAGATGLAVAVDGVVVPRAAWASHPLRGGESVEVVTAVQGG